MTDTLDTKNGKPFEAETEYLYQKKIEALAEGLRRAIRWIEIDPAMKEGDDWNDLQVARDTLERINEK